MDRPKSPMWRWRGGGLSSARTAIMAILNVTPDSFHDGGRHGLRDEAIVRAWAIVDEGADLLDVGGESTRPGADPVSAAEERSRVLPVIEALVQGGYPLPISVDTTRASVAEAALRAGAAIVNDVSGGLREPEILGVVAAADAALVLMHMRGSPQTMHRFTAYADVVSEVADALDARCEAARVGGVRPDRICVDPGIGFAKTAEGSVALIARLDELVARGRPVLLGASRKSFLGGLFGQEGEARLHGSLAVVAHAAASGVAVVRVHDVAASRRVVDVADALAGRTDRLVPLPVRLASR